MENFDTNEYKDFIEIADLIDKEKYIRFPSLGVINESNNLESELLPFSTYYYGLLKLFFKNYDEQCKGLDILIGAIEIARVMYSEDAIVNIKEASNELRNKLGLYNKKDDFIFNGIDGKYEFNFEKLEKINSTINIENETKNILEKIKKARNNCVAIAYPYCSSLRDATNSYLSISGTKIDYVGLIKLPKHRVEPYVQQVYFQLNSFLSKLFSYKFIECHLIEKTNRYTYLSRYLSKGRFDGRVLKRPETYIRDYWRFHHYPGFYRHYSCAERKILAYMDFINYDYGNLIKGKTIINKLTSYKFRILNEPCKMCLPALIGCYNILTLNNSLTRKRHIVLSKSFDSHTPLVLK